MERLTKHEQPDWPQRPIGPWDAPPRDGPAVLVVHRPTMDHGELVGGWLPVSDDDDQQIVNLVRVIGDSSPREWVVIDQVGLGPIMVDEELNVGSLSRQIG